MAGTCEDCVYNVYDDEMDEYICEERVRTTVPEMTTNWYAIKTKG